MKSLIHLSVLTTGRHEETVGRIIEAVCDAKVSLLLHEAVLAHPLPDQQLSHLGAGHGHAFSEGIEANRVDQLVLEALNYDYSWAYRILFYVSMLSNNDIIIIIIMLMLSLWRIEIKTIEPW